MLHAPVFHPISQGPPSHRVAIVAQAYAQTVPLPGRASDLHVIALSEDGHRFAFSQPNGNGFVAYGGGVTLKVVERAHGRFFATAVSVNGTAKVKVTYTLKH